MKRQPSLSTRAFFFAFVPMCLTLVASFFVINKAVEGRIKGRLRLSLQRAERLLANRDAEHREQTLHVLSALMDNPSLKAVLGLLREASDSEARAEVYGILADQLRGINESLEYDLLLLENPAGETVVGLDGVRGSKLSLTSKQIEFLGPGVLRVGGALYEAIPVPINLGNESLGRLILGEKLNLSSWQELGYAALMQDGKAILTTFPGEQIGEMERVIEEHCGAETGECEIRVAGESYLARAVQKESFDSNTRLFTFQSIDAAMSGFTKSIQGVFLGIGVGGVLLILVFSAFGARSIAQPLTKLIDQLRQSERNGQLPSPISTNFQATEVNALARAFNRAAGAVKDSERRLDEATEQFIETMAQALDARDPYTAGHSDRVSVNSTALAEALGLPPEQIEIIRVGAKLHDIGKIGIPDAILRKAGPLTRDEFMHIKLHPQIGKRILEQVESFSDYLPIVDLHHENYDGSGYPYGIKREEIPPGVRIVHVADVYDAITSDRAYRKAMADEEVMKILRQGAGKEFDPAVVEAFLQVLDQRKVLNETLELASSANVMASA
ncbi:MAG: HD-GYP domain-containing protein [Acidobacteria bacterium]|nr:HD-GYP domain-containing protein [Acidobacteriota bacterium]